LATLQAEAGAAPVLQVTVTALQATLTYLDMESEQARTLIWEDGQWWQADSDVLYVEQAAFDLADFDLSDVGAMFASAAELDNSDINQQLQINEYNEGRVLMTVTTSPESVTVFFRPDATLINQLDFTVAIDVAEALHDTCADVVVLAIGINQQGFWADVRRDEETIERFIRPAGLPAYSSLRNQSSSLTTFAPTVVDPVVLAELLTRLPVIISGDPEARIELVIDARDGVHTPKLHFTVGLTTVVYTLDGRPV
jgi:hypothetical protein